MLQPGGWAPPSWHAGCLPGVWKLLHGWGWWRDGSCPWVWIPDECDASSEHRRHVSGRCPYLNQRHLTLCLGVWSEDTPYTVGGVGEYLGENQGWITTPELHDLLDSGDLLEATSREVVYSVGTKPGIRFPTDRDLAIRFVRKRARHGDESSILVRDPNEAEFFCNTLGGTDHLLNFKKAGDVYYIKYRDGMTRAQWFHIWEFVLAYTNVMLRRMLRWFPQEEALQVCTDAIYTKALPDEFEDMLVEDHSKYGQWRHKPSSYEWRPKAHTGRLNTPDSSNWQSARPLFSPQTSGLPLLGGCISSAQVEAVRWSGWWWPSLDAN